MPNPISLRLGEATLDRLTRRAKRSQLAPRTLAQRYIEEGLRHDAHPTIHFVDGPGGRRAALLGTGLDVWEAIAVVRDNDGDVAEAAGYLEAPVNVLQAAVDYYAAYREEIDDLIETNEQAVREAHATWLAGQRAFAA
ncbi:MAG TPA: hypothetical protein VMU32_00940 [Solirubrobacteraceae bacterium]|nr:hypothetical protein [Solirubrobacteraceae bacterium]